MAASNVHSSLTSIRPGTRQSQWLNVSCCLTLGLNIAGPEHAMFRTVDRPWIWLPDNPDSLEYDPLEQQSKSPTDMASIIFAELNPSLVNGGNDGHVLRVKGRCLWLQHADACKTQWVLQKSEMQGIAGTSQVQNEDA